MSGSGFSRRRGKSGAEEVSVRIPRIQNNALLQLVGVGVLDDELENRRRDLACRGARIATAQPHLVNLVNGYYMTGQSKPQKTVRFSLTQSCPAIIDSFMQNHANIISQERAIQVLLHLGIEHEENARQAA